MTNFIFADEVTQQQEMIDRAIRESVNTCLPGVIDSFDSATQMAVVTPAIQAKKTIEGVDSYFNLPQIVNVPIVIPFGSVGGFGLTVKVSAGDPCLLVFSQRCLDNWLQSGGVQPPEQNTAGLRHHDLTDAFAIMAPASTADAFSNWSNEGIEIRNRARTIRTTVLNNKVEIVAGTSTITLLESGAINIVAPVSVGITTPLLTLTGDLAVTGYIKDSLRKMSEDRSIYNSHTHADAQGGTTGSPNQTE